MNTTAARAAARAAIASTLIGSAFVTYFGLELRLPGAVIAPLGLGENASDAVAALTVPVVLLAVAAVLLVQVLRTPGLVPAVVRTARARWAQRLAAVALVVGAPVVHLALVMPSVVLPLSTLEVVVAYAVPSAMLLAALALAAHSFRRPSGRAGALAA